MKDQKPPFIYKYVFVKSFDRKIMKFTILGAGGIGGYYAGKLRKAGYGVQLIARGQQLEMIRSRGLTIVTDDDKFTVTPDVTTDNIKELVPSEVLVIAVKADQVKSMLEPIRPLIREATYVITIQNGVDAYRDLSQMYPGNSLGGLTKVISFVDSPGIIRRIGAEAILRFGRADGKKDKTMENISKAFNDAGINCSISEDIVKDIWEKFLIMATMGGLGAVTQAPIGVLLSIKEMVDLMDDSMNEIVKIARINGITLNDESKNRAWQFFRSLPFGATSSTQRDVASGKPSEIDYLSGAVARMGKEGNVPVPLHSFIDLALKARELKARGKIDF